MRARFVGTIGLLMAMAAPAVAQQPPVRQAQAPRQAAPAQPAAPRANQRMQARPNQGPSPEAIIRMREQLALTEAQVTRLEALRVEGVAAQRTRMAEMLEMQSKVRAGAITPEQVREQMQARAGQAAPAGQQAIGERVRAVLTDQQRVRLAEMQVQQMQNQMRGRQMQGRQQRGSAAGRGTQRGGRGMSRGGRGMQGGGRGGMMPGGQGMQRGARGAAPAVRPGMQGLPGRGRGGMVPPTAPNRPPVDPN